MHVSFSDVLLTLVFLLIADWRQARDDGISSYNYLIVNNQEVKVAMVGCDDAWLLDAIWVGMVKLGPLVRRSLSQRAASKVRSIAWLIVESSPLGKAPSQQPTCMSPLISFLHLLVLDCKAWRSHWGLLWLRRLI
jgi:hypothetical protein